jgi:hypothetical protein
LKLNISESFVRYKIYSEVFTKYLELKSKLPEDDPFYYKKVKLYKPPSIFTFYMLFIPWYFFQCNLYIFWKLRADISFSKYVLILLFNILSLYVFYIHADKKIFMEYLKKPHPYSKYMREEFLKNKEKVTPSSYHRVQELDNKINSTYKF